MLEMTRNRFLKNSYRSNFRGKVTVEDAQKHQQYIDDLCTRQISQNPYPIRILPS